MGKTIRSLLWIFFVATILGFLFTLDGYFFTPPQQFDWADQVGWNFLAWYSWAILCLPIYRLSYRFPLDARPRFSRVMLHLLFAALIASAQLALNIIFYCLLVTPSQPLLFTISSRHLVCLFRLPWRLLVYGIILFGSWSISSRRRLEQGRRKTVELESRITQMRIEGLKNQLSPKFLFGCLRSVSSLIPVDVEQADKLIVRLGAFLRRRLDRNGKGPGKNSAEEPQTGKITSSPEPFWDPVAFGERHKFVLILVFWTLIFLYTWARALHFGQPAGSIGVLLIYGAWYIWVPLTPVILWASRRFPLIHRQWYRHLAIHVLMNVLLWFVADSVYSLIRMAILPHKAGFLQVLADKSLQQIGISLDLVIYWSIVAVCEAFRHFANAQQTELRNANLELQLGKARLQAIKMQIHPHFLFNTLNSISELMHEDPVGARKMVKRLEDFLSLTLKNPTMQEVPLRDELELLNCYLDIQQMRFADRLTVDMKIDPGTLEKLVPNLIWQPIVENAMRHGVGRITRQGRLEIASKQIDDRLLLEVKDNGPGLPDAGNYQEGFGISNTRALLEQFYGSRHRFQMKNAPEGGLVVTMEMPATTSVAP